MMHPATQKSKQEEAFDRTFEEGMAASRDPDNRTLMVHKWEGYFSDHDRLDPDPLKEEEIKSVLEVMSGDPSKKYEDNFHSRVQYGDPHHGMIGLACTAISEHSKSLLYGMGHTGLLVQDAVPVVVSCDDSYSNYRPYLKDKVHAKVGKVPIVADHTITAIQEKVREAQQITSPSHVEIDPRNEACLANARNAYGIMMKGLDSFAKDGGPVIPYNEVCANIKTENIVGVLADMQTEEIDTSTSWAERLDSSERLRTALYDAVDQLPWIREAMQEKGITREPTIVIYQSNARNTEDRFVHFPPTKQNIELLKGAIEKHMGHVLSSHVKQNTSGQQL